MPPSQSNRLSTGTAWGTFTDGEGQSSNFGSLSLQSNAKAPDGDQMFALGFAEGVCLA